MDPDLTITCRCRDGDNVKEKSLQGHSAFFAMNSSYFDALLSSEMEEAASKHVTLEDVDPDTFDKAMTLLEQLDHSSTKLEDLLKVASIYSRFQFEKGIKCLQRRMDGFLKTFSSMDTVVVTSSELDTIIDCALVADEASMEDQTSEVAEILSCILDNNLLQGWKSITLDQVRRLRPFLVAHQHLVGDILNDIGMTRFQRPDSSSTDFPEFLHSVAIESSNCRMIRRSGLKVHINFRISSSSEAQSTDLVRGEEIELTTEEGEVPLVLHTENFHRDANSRLWYSVRLCRFGSRSRDFRQCHHEDLREMDWCVHVVVDDNSETHGSWSNRRHFLAFLPNSKGYLMPPYSTQEWNSLGLVDHFDREGSEVEPLEAPDSFNLSVDRVELVWGEPNYLL